MDQPVFMKLAAVAEEPEAIERSVEYITNHMGQFLKKNERVLICFPKLDNACCHILQKAVVNCECTPVWLGEDRRWLTMLKTAFTSRCNCIIGPPLLLLGLSKVARHMGTPLFARNVLLSGYPSTKWIVSAVERGLDCKAWGCYDPGLGAVITGFSCGQKDGVHIRQEEYGVDIVDPEGNILPEGTFGDVTVYPRSEPTLRFATGNKGRIDSTPCPCGCSSPSLLDLDIDKSGYEPLSEMGESLHYWSSILDCRLERKECGLELEVVVFQGEKLPKFPSCAKMVIRAWNPEADEPFDHYGVLKNKLLFGIDH